MDNLLFVFDYMEKFAIEQFVEHNQSLPAPKRKGNKD